MSIGVFNPISTLGSIGDVDVSPLANGDALIYNSATGDWTATALPGGGDMLKATYDTDLDGVVDTSHDVSATPLITRSSVASQGGLLINIDSATGDIAVTADGFIEDEKYGVYADEIANAASAEFDSAVTRTGRLTAKLSTLDVTGTGRLTIGANSSGITGNKYWIPIKPSTKYKFSVWAKTNNVATGSVAFAGTEFTSARATVSGTFTAWTSSSLPAGTNDWTLLTKTVTTSATGVYLSIFLYNGAAGNISDAWFDINSMTLEEVVEPVANSLTSSSPSLVSFTAVGSTDNIDQSLDPTFVAVNTYTTPVAISEAAADRQTFVPTKSKVTRIGIYPVAKGTGNWTVTIHNASNVVQATITIANASLTNGAVNYFNVPCNLTALASYHFHVTSTVADGTVKVGTAADLETVSYIQNYYKPTTNFKASQNNSTVSISADEDGFPETSTTNIANGTFTANLTKTVNGVDEWGDFYKWLYSSVKAASSSPSNNVGGVRLFYSGLIASSEYIFKINLPSIPSSVKITLPQEIIRYAGGYIRTSWSTTEGGSYTQIHEATFTGSWTAQSSGVLTISPGTSTFFIKLVAGQTSATGSQQIELGNEMINISATLDTSSLSTLRNYPTNKDVVTTYNKSLNTATTTATYRATTYGFPAIEYATNVYQYLDVDTTATGSVVKFSEDGVTYTTVADGASLTITSTTAPIVWVKTNITANRLYLSSNDYNASSDKDGSNMMTVGYEVASQGLTYDMRELQEDVEGILIEGITETNTKTLTNKRISKRVQSLASSATPSSNTDNYDITKITGLAVAITSLTTGLVGTPVDGDEHTWSFTDDGTARAITPGASFENSTVSFPATTVISTRIDVKCRWNSATSKWRVIEVA